MTRAEAAQFTASFDRALDEERQERQLSARGRKMVTQALAPPSSSGAMRALGGDEKATAGAAGAAGAVDTAGTARSYGATSSGISGSGIRDSGIRDSGISDSGISGSGISDIPMTKVPSLLLAGMGLRASLCDIRRCADVLDRQCQHHAATGKKFNSAS
jgi:hypothetical protein